MIYAIAILLPPLALLLRGRLGHALLNVPLTLLFLLPGIVHACVIIARDEREERDLRLALMIQGKPLPPRRGSVPGWLAAVVILAVFGVAGWVAFQGIRQTRAEQGIAARIAAPPVSAAPLPASLPAVGTSYADVEAAHGEPVMRNSASGWAWWNDWKGRFEAGRLMEATRTKP